MTTFEHLVLSGISLLVRMNIIKLPAGNYKGKTNFIALVDKWLEKTNQLFNVEINKNNKNSELFKLTPMDTINIKNVSLDDRGCFNPFNEDKFSCGKLICKDVYMMFRTAGEEELTEAYFLNVRTGQRQGLTLNKEK